MKTAVAQGIDELRRGLPGHTVRLKEDRDGGAFVIVDGLCIGETFEPNSSWIGFHVTFPYPDADVYPHFIDPGVMYIGTGAAPNKHPDGDLPTSLTRGATMPGFEIAAIQVSRRSNRRDADIDTALHKLLRVLEFLRTR